MLSIERKLLHKNIFLLKPLLLLLFFLGSCSPLIAPYNEYVYRELASLKVETHTLIGKATDDYTKHETEVEELDKGLNKLYEYMKALPKNTESTKMMEIMIKGDGKWDGIKKLWKSSSKLNEAAIKEFQNEITEGFDDMIELESKKIK